MFYSTSWKKECLKIYRTKEAKPHRTHSKEVETISKKLSGSNIDILGFKL